VTIRVGQVEEPLAPQRILRRNRHALSLAGRVSVCHRVAVLPPSSRGLTRDLRSPLGAYSFGSGLPAVPAERDGSGVLALILGGGTSSVICPVAILVRWTALPMTSRGRRSPLGPRGMTSLKLVLNIFFKLSE
jgi:hypothetical protein